MKRLGIGAALLLTACSGAGGWHRPGADAAAVASAYADCRGTASTAVKTDAEIDQDILASRQSDWQRAGVVRRQTQIMGDTTRERADKIIASCMKAKGFIRGR